MDTVSLDTYTPQITAALNIDSPPGPLPMDSEVARMRAFKAAYGIQDPKYSEEELYKHMSNGYEDVMRNQVARDVDVKKSQENMSFLERVAAAPITTAEDVSKAFFSLDNKPTDPNSVFEKAFAKQYVNSVDDALARNYTPNTKQSLSEAFSYVKPGTSDLITKQQMLMKWAQDIANQDVAAQSTAGYVADWAKTLVQPYNEIKQRGIAPDVSFFNGFLGGNLRKQAESLYRLPTEKMMEVLKPHIEKLRKDNPQLAVQYLSSLAHMTNEEEVVNNLFTLMMPVDIATLVQGARGIPKTAGIQTNVTDLMSGKVVERRAVTVAKDLVKAGTEEPLTPATIASATGDVAEAGIKRAADIVDTHLKGNTDIKTEVRQDASLLTSNYRVDKTDIQNNVGTRGADFSNRILQAYDRSELQVIEGIGQRTLIDKAPGVFESESALRQLTDRVKNSNEYKGLGSSASDVEFVHDPLSNTMSYNIVLRQPNGYNFAMAEDAWGWGRLNNIKNFKVRQEGIGFNLTINTPFKETDTLFQNLLVPTAHEADPQGLLRSWIGWAINPDETLSSAHRMNRKIAAYGPSWLMGHGATDAKMIQSFARGAVQVNPLTGKTEVRELKGMRQRYQDWQQMIEGLRTAPDPDHPEAGLGKWLKSVHEMEDYYSVHYNRLPEEAEVQAYFAYKRLNEYDRILRDLRYHSNMWREGVQDHTFTYTGKNENDPANVEQKLNFRGTKIGHLPRTEGSLLYIDGTERGSKVYDAARLGGAEKKLQKGLDEGSGSIYRVWNPAEHEFSGFGPVNEEHWVRYVYVEGGAETKNIPFNLLPRRGGGHWDVDHPFYLSQPIIYMDRATTTAGGKKAFRAVYAGDRTVMPIQIRAMGEKLAYHLNEIRKLLKKGDGEAAEAYHNAHAKEIGVPFDEQKGWYNSTTDASGRKVKAMLSLDHDIQIRPKDAQLIDINKDISRIYDEKKIPFVDGTKTGNPARQAQIQYTGMRDSQEIWTVNDRGTRYNPLYSYEPGRLVDPVETMNRALTKITQSTYLEDYKQFAVSHWLKQASHYLEVPDKEISAVPYHYFYAPEWKKSVPQEIKNRFMAQNANIRQFLGQANPVDRLIQETTQKMVDKIYGAAGPNAVKLVPNWMLFGMRDPVNFIKQVTYHAALGLFSIPQIVVQMQTYALIAALSPRSVIAGSYAAMLHQWARINPAMLETLDKWATKLNIPGFHGWKPGELKEAHFHGNRMGFFDVQGEHAFIDDIMNGNKLVKGYGKTFLDWGTMPFRGGERHVRLGAWYTAFKEFRVEHPTGRLTEKDLAGILNRADDLYGNMSRASSSAIHQGIFSIPTQFLAYQLRIAELFLGSRTSISDKARMVAVFSALYGVPMSAGLTGLPLGDYLKRKALEEGYVVGDNWITTLIAEGIPATFVAWATGGGDISKGTFYNFGERYAANGMDMFRGDKSMWDVMTGPAGSKVKGLIEDMSPFWQVMMSAFRDDDKVFPITIHDFYQPIKNFLSSGTNVDRTLAALQTGRYMSKKGIYLDDTSPLSALFMFITGAQPSKVTDANYMNITIKEREEYKKSMVKEFESNFKQGLRIATGSGQDQSTDFFKRAFVYLWLSGAREDELTGILARASKDNQSLVDQVDWSYYVKNAPSYSKTQMYEAFSRKLNTGK